VIIEGTTHDNAGMLARYLLRAKSGEKEFLRELRDSASDNLREALTDWEACGRALTKGEKILYHTHIRLRDGESLKDAQWMQTIERLEEGLGLMSCPRAIVGHKSTERGLHVHVVWSRLDAETERLAPLSYDRKQFHSVARWAEMEFGLEPPKPAVKRKPGNRKTHDRELRALKDRGIDRETITKLVRAAWRGSESGDELVTMLSSLGVEIEAGERRDYVIRHKGLKMNPVRLLEGVKASEFRERMKDAEIPKEGSGSLAGSTRRAESMLAEQFQKEIAKDDVGSKPKTSGFAKRKPKAPAPRLRRKLWYGDPGI
jgi:hypothetical protein